MTTTTTVDVKIEVKGTHVAVHNFKVAHTFNHISTVNETFDYISVSAKVSEQDSVGLFLSLDLANDLISRLTMARDSLVSGREKADLKACLSECLKHPSRDANVDWLPSLNKEQA